MKLLSIQVGLPRDVQWQGKQVSTGIFKAKVEGSRWVGKTGIEGDGQADLTVHGGEDKAVYALSADVYPWWKETLKTENLNGAFGENLTVSVLDEKEFCLGDVYSLGNCALQVVQPRFPCFKLGIKFGDMKILDTFTKSGRPGIYFRVLKEGEIQAGDEWKLQSKDPEAVPLIELFHMKTQRSTDLEQIIRVLRVKSLNAGWRQNLEKKLASLESP